MAIGRLRSNTKDTLDTTELPISGYRFMWLLVMFDLPVTTKCERAAANAFRNDLLDIGFERCQFSVYLKYAEGYSQAGTISRKIQKCVPEEGKVYVLYFTDKQYESILRFENSKQLKRLENPGQFELF